MPTIARSFAGVVVLVTVLLPCLAPSASAASDPIRLNVDLTEAPRNIFHAHLAIPVSPGPVTLLYPKWIPGEHGPTGPIVNLAGLVVSAGGRPIPWRRDDIEMYAFHCTVPAGVHKLDVSLDYLAPQYDEEAFIASAVSTANIAVLEWNEVLVYPKDPPAEGLTYLATLRLPAGWKYGT